jgi:GNAT superfamily N-acetyltransferase
MPPEPAPWPVPIDATHDVDSFDCGVGRVNGYLARHALTDQGSAKIRTYVLAQGGRVTAYCTVAPGVVEAVLSRDRIERRQRRQLIPVVVLTHIAVDLEWQRRGYGTALLEWVIHYGLDAAQVIGAGAVVTTAIGKEARSFVEQNGFVPFPGDARRLYVRRERPWVRLVRRHSSSKSIICLLSQRGLEGPRVWVSWGRHGFDGAHV